jgi:phosphatidylinositol glycan class B
LFLALGFITAALISTCADFWLYDQLVFTPWHYFQQNILAGKAAGFGVSPWWHYFYLFFLQITPPLSIGLAILFIIGLFVKRQSVFVWSAIPFFILHVFVGHKELRFLFPLLPQLIIIASFGLDYLVNKYDLKPWGKLTIKIVFILNLILLTYRTLGPSQEMFAYYSKVYQIAEKEKILVVTLHKDFYEYASLKMDYCQSPNVETNHFESMEELDLFLKSYNNLTVYYIHNQLKLDTELESHHTTKIYSVLPNWVDHLDFNDWQSRSNLYSIYKLERK